MISDSGRGGHVLAGEHAFQGGHAFRVERCTALLMQKPDRTLMTTTRRGTLGAR